MAGGDQVKLFGILDIFSFMLLSYLKEIALDYGHLPSLDPSSACASTSRLAHLQQGAAAHASAPQSECFLVWYCNA